MRFLLFTAALLFGPVLTAQAQTTSATPSAPDQQTARAKPALSADDLRLLDIFLGRSTMTGTECVRFLPLVNRLGIALGDK